MSNAEHECFVNFVSNLLEATDHNANDYDVDAIADDIDEYASTIHSREDFDDFLRDYIR